MEKKDYFELHPSLKPLRFNDVFKYVVQREIDEDKIGAVSKNGSAYNFARGSCRTDEFDKLFNEIAPNYNASYHNVIINKDKFLNSKDIPWSVPDIRNYSNRYAWCAIINNAPFEIDGRVLVMNVLPALIYFVKALGLELDGVTAIDKWAVWESNPLAYKVYSPFCIWDNFVLEGIELNEGDKKQLVELKEDTGIASNECSEIRVFNPVTQTHPVESVYNINHESIYGPSIIGALLFGYLDKVDEPGKDLTELINKNRENIDLLNRYVYKFGKYLPDSGYFTASEKIRECITFQSNSASLPNEMGNDLRKMVATYFHRKTFIEFNKAMEVNHGIRLNTYDDGRSFASITMLIDPNLPDTFDNEVVYCYPS